jgi:hypothetical protein
VLHPVPEIEAELRTNVTHPLDPVPLCAVKQGQVIFLLPERLMKLNLEDPDRPQTELLRTASGSRLEKFSALTLARDGGLWVGGTRGLAKASGPARNIRADTVWKEYVAPETLDLHQFTQLHEDEEGSVTSLALTKGEQKVIVRFDGRHWETVPLGTEKIRQAWQGPGGSLWAIAIDTLLQWKGGAWGENEEVLARQYFGWPPPMACSGMRPRSGGARHCRPPGRSIQWFNAFWRMARTEFGSLQATRSTACRKVNCTIFHCHPPRLKILRRGRFFG